MGVQRARTHAYAFLAAPPSSLDSEFCACAHLTPQRAQLDHVRIWDMDLGSGKVELSLVPMQSDWAIGSQYKPQINHTIRCYGQNVPVTAAAG